MAQYPTYLSIEQIDEWKILTGNFSISPTYIGLVTDFWNTLSWYYAPRMWYNYTFPKSLVDDFIRLCYCSMNDIYCVFVIAFVITLIRYAFERFIFKPLANYLQLTLLNKRKFPESAWKCLSHTCAWLYCFYLIQYRYDYFHEPYLIWDDWSPGMEVPFDIKVMFFVQCGFYLHSMYGTLYMDYKRKDFYAMLLHHVTTILLLFVSYAVRYHKAGLLVQFLNDITDIWLELSKLLHYLSSREGDRVCPGCENAAWSCFTAFTLCWFVFRLYWYPLKVLYSTGVVAVYRVFDKGAGLYGFLNGLLWILFCLNIYWSIFILQILYTVCNGPLPTRPDKREDMDDNEE